MEVKTIMATVLVVFILCASVWLRKRKKDKK